MDETRTNLSRRDRQSAARANQILDAAAALFAERGFHRTTTREIAEAADVAEGTLYNYFANKDDLLIGIMQRLSQSFDPTSLPMRRIPMNVREHFASLLEVRKSFQDQNMVRMQAVLSEIMANAELRERFYEQLVRPSIKSLEKTLKLHGSIGQIRDKDVPEMARFMASIFIGLFFLELLGDPIVSSENNRCDEVSLAILFDGIAAGNQELRTKKS